MDSINFKSLFELLDKVAQTVSFATYSCDFLEALKTLEKFAPTNLEK